MHPICPPAHGQGAEYHPVSKLKIRASGGAAFLREVGFLMTQEHALHSSLEASLRFPADDFSATTHDVLEEQRREVAAGISRLEHGFDLPVRPPPAAPQPRLAPSGGWQGLMPSPGQRTLADLAARHRALGHIVDLLVEQRPRARASNRILVQIARGHEGMADGLTALLRDEPVRA